MPEKSKNQAKVKENMTKTTSTKTTKTAKSVKPNASAPAEKVSAQASKPDSPIAEKFGGRPFQNVIATPRVAAEAARIEQAIRSGHAPLAKPMDETKLEKLRQTQIRWSEDIKAGALTEEDLERALAYAQDLMGGMEVLRTFSQGVTVFGSARVSEDNKYYQAARELGQKLAQNGHTVITGGGPGIMEAANRGAYEYGGRSIGLNITLDHEQFPNQYLTDVLEFRYFFARKVMLSMASKAYVFMPGGFGTMDEMTEVVILMQEHKMPKMPVFLFGKTFWRPLEKFYRNRLVADGLIKPEDMKIMRLTDDVDEIVTAANKIGHFRVDENFYDHVSA